MSASLHMPAEREHPLATRLRDATRLVALGIAAFGVLRLILVWLGPAPEDLAAYPTLSGTLFLMLSGLSLYLHLPSHGGADRRRAGKLLAVLAGGVLVAAAVAAGPELGAPMRLSPVVLVSGLLGSLSLLLLQMPGWPGRLGWLIAVAILANALFVLIDDLYSFTGFNSFRPYDSLELATASAYVLLAVGLLLANPAYSPMRLLASVSPGGFMTRRLLLPALGLPLLLHWTLHIAVRENLIDMIDLSLGYSAATSALIVSLAAVICYQAGVLDRLSREAQSRLTAAQTKLRLAVDIASVGYWEKDLNSRIFYFSPEWKRLLGYTDDEIGGDRDEWLSRLHPDDLPLVLSRLKALTSATAAEHRLEFRLRHKDGDYRWMASRAVLGRDEHGRPVRIHGVHVDITERKETERRIRQVSQHDPLTGLPNRALIREFIDAFLATARRSGRHVAVLFVDLDRFKPINDEHGHEAGDEVLKEVSRRLRASVRESDLVGRLGGDEFLVVLADVHSEMAAARVARVCVKRLGRPYSFRGVSLSTSSSIGISLFPRDGGDVDELIRSADSAMYAAKKGGRNTFRFYRPECRKKTR